MMMPMSPTIYPSLYLTSKDLTEIKDFEFGDKIKLSASYQIISKNENGIRLKLTNMSVDNKARKI